MKFFTDVRSRRPRGNRLLSGDAGLAVSWCVQEHLHFSGPLASGPIRPIREGRGQKNAILIVVYIKRLSTFVDFHWTFFL